MKKYLLLLALFAILLVTTVFLKATFSISTPARQEIIVGGETVNVSLARTPLERSRGLSGAPGLKENEGMLFIFDTPDYHGFWMKGMRFPLDIIWFDDSGRIVDIAESVLPESYPKTFISKDRARYVLEVNAGFVSSHAVRIGDKISLE